MSDRKANGRSFGGKGYYIALILCAAAIGISGYLYYRNANKQTVGQAQEASIRTVMGGKAADAAAAATGDGPQAAAEDTAAPQPLKTASPVAGETVSPYAMDCLSYNQTTRDWRIHNGVDIAAEAGTPVCAAADGTVYTIYDDETMGQTVVIRHDGGYVTKYSSLGADPAVEVGDEVKLGQTIGSVGNTALMESALGDHVHFSVTCDGKPMDPGDFLALS